MPVTLGIYGATDATGWSVVTPTEPSAEGGDANPAGSKLIHVADAAHGGDDGNPGTAALPYRTLAYAMTKLKSRAGYGDWILLKRDCVWKDEVFGSIAVASPSPDNPTVFTAYGTGARPLIMANNSVFSAIGFNGTANNLVFMDLDMYCYVRDPDHAEFSWEAAQTGISCWGITNPHDFCLIENCRSTYFADNSFSRSADLYCGDFILRRSVIFNNYWAEGTPHCSTTLATVSSGQISIFLDNVEHWFDRFVTSSSHTVTYDGNIRATYNATISGGAVTAMPQTKAGNGYVNGDSYNLVVNGIGTGAVAHAIGQSNGTLGPAIIDNGGSGYDATTTISADKAPTHSMVGNLVSFNRTTGELILDITSASSVGTFSSWTVSTKGGHSQGFYLSKIGGSIRVEENFLDHNGWSEHPLLDSLNTRMGLRNKFNHSFYFSGSGERMVGSTIRGNVLCRGSNNNVHRDGAGGWLTNNLCMGHVNFGYCGGSATGLGSPGPWDISQNVLLHGVNSSDFSPPGEGGWGQGNGPFLQGAYPSPSDGSTMVGNICAHLNHAGGANSGPRIDGPHNCLLKDNIIYKFKTGNPLDVRTNTAGTTTIEGNLIDLNGDNLYGWPDPNRTIVTYDTLFGGPGTTVEAAMDHFMGLCYDQERGNWNTALTADAANDYFRAGFGLVSETATPPTVTTVPATSLTATTAVLGGNVAANGGSPITERGVVWSQSLNPTVADYKQSAPGTLGGFTVPINNLLPSTLYHFRAYAINAIGIAYGSDDTFTTEASGSPPTVETSGIGALTHKRVVLLGDVTSDNGSAITERGFVLNSTGAPTTSDTKIIVPGTTGAMRANYQGIVLGQHYFVRAFATNAVGTAYGDLLEFTAKTSYRTSLTLKVRG